MTPSLPELCSTRRQPFAGASLRATLTAIGLCAPLFMGAAAKAQFAVATATCDIGVIGSTNACDLTPGTVLFTLGDKQVTFLGLATNDPALVVPLSVNYSWINPTGDLDFSDDSWQLQVAADPLFANTGPLDPYTLSFSYQVDIVDGALPAGTSDPWFFNTVSLESDVIGGAGAVVINKDTFDNTPVLLSTLTSTNGQSTPVGVSSYTFTDDLKSIIITDSLSVPLGRTVSSVTNGWTQRRAATPVPGPLPILGAGVAFGMSRRLRRRINTTSVA